MTTPRERAAPASASTRRETAEEHAGNACQILRSAKQTDGTPSVAAVGAALDRLYKAIAAIAAGDY